MSTAIEDPAQLPQVEQPTPIEALPALARAEIDASIATARRFPRSITDALRQAQSLATYNVDVAESCLYAVPRDGKTIKGPSARLAEILESSWGNIRVQGRIIEVSDRFIVARGECHDLERNNARAVEVRRRITNKWGKRYSDDMITTTANAAISIACRNAIFAVIPRAMWWPIYLAAEKVAVGSADTLEVRRKRIMEFFRSHSVKDQEVFAALEIKGMADIDLDRIATMIGWKNAIEDNAATIQDIFRANQPEPGTNATSKLADQLRKGRDKQPKSSTPLLDQSSEPENDPAVWPEGKE